MRRLLYNPMVLSGGTQQVPLGAEIGARRGILDLADKLDASAVMQARNAAWRPVQVPTAGCIWDCF